jgi:hypothetical protein
MLEAGEGASGGDISLRGGPLISANSKKAKSVLFMHFIFDRGNPSNFIKPRDQKMNLSA